MRRTITCIAAWLLGLVLAAQPFEPVNPDASPEARALLSDLYRTVAEGKIISALHHNQLQLPNYLYDLDRIEDASRKVTDDGYVFSVTLSNKDKVPAMMLRLKAVDKATGDLILPVL